MEIYVSLILHFFLFNLLIFFYTFFYTHDIHPRRFLIHKINALQLFPIHLFVFIFFLYFFLPTSFTHTHDINRSTLHGDKSGMFLKRGYSLIKDWQRSHNENAKPASFSIKCHSFYIIVASFQNLLVHSTVNETMYYGKTSAKNSTSLKHLLLNNHLCRHCNFCFRHETKSKQFLGTLYMMWFNFILGLNFIFFCLYRSYYQALPKNKRE